MIMLIYVTKGEKPYCANNLHCRGKICITDKPNQEDNVNSIAITRVPYKSIKQIAVDLH